MTRLPRPGSKAERVAAKRLGFRMLVLGEERITRRSMRPLWRRRAERRELGRQRAQRACRARTDFVRSCVAGIRFRARQKSYKFTGPLTMANALKTLYTPERVEALTFRRSPLVALVESAP